MHADPGAYRDNRTASVAMSAFVPPVPLLSRPASLSQSLHTHQRRRPRPLPHHSPGFAPCGTAAAGDASAASDKPAIPTQPVSMPALYSAWFPPGNDIAEDVRAAIARSLDAGKVRMEVKFPCVPNLEEIKFGTKNNYEFGKFVSRTLGMSAQEDYPLIKRYLGEFSNLYWYVLRAWLCSHRDSLSDTRSSEGASKSRNRSRTAPSGLCSPTA